MGMTYVERVCAHLSCHSSAALVLFVAVRNATELLAILHDGSIKDPWDSLNVFVTVLLQEAADLISEQIAKA